MNQQNSLQIQQHLHWFRFAAPYIKTHRHKTFVILLTGETVLHPNFVNIIHDIALLHALGIRLILVYGARPQIENSLAQQHTQTDFFQQYRLTPRESMTSIINAVSSVALELQAQLSASLENSPMQGANLNVVSGNFVNAKPYGVRNGIDFQLTGEVRSIQTEAIQTNLQQQHIVIIGPLGFSSTGEIYNLLAEDVAAHTAVKMQADKLILFTKNEGLLNEKGALIRELNLNQAEQQLQKIQSRTIQAQQADYTGLAAAIDACKRGIKRTHFISFSNDGALLQELFSHDGTGTLISHKDYEDIRPARMNDIAGLIRLIEPLEAQGILVFRSRQQLENEIQHFSVIDRDGMIIGCAALYPLAETDGQNNEKIRSAELACVAVHPDYQKSQRANLLLQYIEKQAKLNQINQLFVLTTRAHDWFVQRGFISASLNDLPPNRQNLYNYQRNSLIFKKKLK